MVKRREDRRVMGKPGVFFTLSTRELIMLIGTIIGAAMLLNTRASEADLNKVEKSVVACENEIDHLIEGQDTIEQKLDLIHADIKELLQRTSALEAGVD